MSSGHSSSSTIVEVWKIQVSSCRISSCTELLSPEELSRMLRFRYPADQNRYAVAHASLRSILGKKLGADHKDLQFIQGEFGKPCLLNDDLKFSLSHSGDCVWIAVSQSANVGIDVEKIKDIDADALIRRFGSAEEGEFFRSLPANNRLDAFFTWWTRKEAFLKGMGKGLSGGLSTFTAWQGDDRPVQVQDSGQEWMIYTLEADPGYCGALAVSSSVSRIVERHMLL